MTARQDDTGTRRHGDTENGSSRPRVSASPHLRFLLVDDHGLFLEGLQNLLRAGGYQVVG